MSSASFVHKAHEMAETKERKTRSNCPKCGSAAWGATRTKVPISQEFNVYTRAKCLQCGAEFDLVDTNQ